MGVDTKMFIGTKKENILEIMPKVIEAINVWQRADLDRYVDLKGFGNRMMYIFRDKDLEKHQDLKNYSNGISSVDTYDFRSFYINLIIASENRSLFVTHSCSSDYSDVYKGDKIIFSLGCWGLSEEIMMVVAEAIKEYGKVFYCQNDCNGEYKELFTN